MIVSEFKKEIIQNIEIKFDKVFKDEDFSDFLKKNADKIEKTIKEISVDEMYIKEFLKKNERTRNRWIQYEKNEGNSVMNQELEFSKKLYNKDIKSFKSIYHCEDVNSLKNKLYSALEKWKKEDRYFLDYPYVSAKNVNAKRKGAINDVIEYIILKLNKSRDIVLIPSMLKDIPEDTTNRIKFTNPIIEGNSISQNLYEGKQISLNIDKAQYLTLTYNEGLSEDNKLLLNEIKKKLKVFNSLDREILQYILQQTKEIYSNDKIDRYVADITVAIGKANTKLNRKAVKDTLLKLGNSGYSKENKFVGRFFSIKFEKEIKGKIERDLVHIYIDGLLRDIILKNSTISFYADKFNLLSKDAQKILINIQNERIIRVLNNNNSLTENKTLSDFREAIYFKSSRGMKDRVVAALNELKEHKMAIKNYKNEKYNFYIEYYKFSEKDIEIIKGSKADYIEDGHKDIINLTK